MVIILLLCVGLASSVPLHDEITPRAGEACGYESCTEAEAGLLNVHLVAHTHDDVGWLKTVDQYYYGSRNDIQKAGVQYILDSVIKELWENPKRKFIYVETAFFWKWWTRQSDHTRHRVHALVRQGRLQFVGGAWSMNDEAASHYQSTVDQFTWGLGKLNRTFGTCGIPRVGWQIDPFGHSREFASLLAAMGYDGLFLGRIDYQDKRSRLARKDMEVVWRGDDDLGKQSDIFTGALYNTYQPPPGFCFDVLCSDEPIVDDADSPMFNVDKRVGDFLEFVAKQANTTKTRNVIITMGGDFTYQDAGMWYTNLDKLIEYTNLKAAKDGLDIKLFYSTPDCYLKSVKDANPTLAIKQDDFFPYASDPNAYWTGYFTSRPTTKYFERQGNNYLQMVKQLQVLAGLEDHNQFVLNELKSAMGVMQHHDAITGTEKQHVTHDYERLLNDAIEDALTIARQALNKMMQGDALKPPLFQYERCHLNESRCEVSETSDQFMVTAYNHLAWNVNESIRIPVVDGTYEVIAPNGERIVSQIVDIPSPVLNIPTRQSKATHEIVFIAYLKPVSFKSYYIRKTKKVKRQTKTQDLKRINDYYANINDYWKSIKENTFVDIKNIEEKPLRHINTENEMGIPEYVLPVKKLVSVAPVENRYVKEAKGLDLDVLKDGEEKNKETLNQDILQLEKLIKDTKAKEQKIVVQDKSRSGLEKMVVYPTLNDDELRMLGDDPMVVQRYTDDYLVNKYLKLRIDNLTNELTHVILPDGTEVKLNLQYHYYPACVGDNSEYTARASGAYIFRPNATVPIDLTYNYTQGPRGPVVQEIRIQMSDNAASYIRIYEDLNFLENEWVIGPIDITDDIGKEYIVKYRTDLINNGVFYTDSNGRQMLKRILNKRPQWNLTLEEPVAGNYYPVTNEIYIDDGKSKVAVLTDRSEGGTSLNEGEIELMLHRRLLHDDAFGVGEALNETASGKGLVVRGRHRIFISRSGNKADYLQERKQMLQFHLQPQVFVSDAKNVSLEDWLALTKAHSWANALPEGLHLLTLEPWHGTTMLLRLENYVDDIIAVDISKIFKGLTVKSFKETTLAANQWLKDGVKWQWNTEEEFSDGFNKNYGSFEKVETAKGGVKTEDDGFNVKINGKQIRTFVVDYEIKAM